MTRPIRPHKGGRTARAPDARIRPQTLRSIHATMQERGMSWGDLVEEQYGQGDKTMSNSYGAGFPPEGALYGVYDSDNGEWIGRWFNDKKSAQEEANKLRRIKDPRLGVVSVADDDDWL